MKGWAGKSWAGGALGALILVTAAPAMAGGYWDAGGAPVDPPAAAPCRLGDRPCPPPPCPEARAGWRIERSDGAPAGGHEVVVPAEFFETGGVGPDFLYDEEGGGGGVVVQSSASAGAEAFASASARVGVQIGFRGGRFHHPTTHCACGGHGRR
jgi:hypothetical protein